MSDLGQFGLSNGQDPFGKPRLRLTSFHPGTSIEHIQARTGFELEISPEVCPTPLPSVEDLRLLREEIDPLGIHRSIAQWRASSTDCCTRSSQSKIKCLHPNSAQVKKICCVLTRCLPFLNGTLSEIIQRCAKISAWIIGGAALSPGSEYWLRRLYCCYPHLFKLPPLRITAIPILIHRKKPGCCSTSLQAGRASTSTCSW